MVLAPVVATAAVQSATNDEGLINKLFKVTMLVGFFLILILGIFILNLVVDIFGVVGGVVEDVGLSIRVFSGVGGGAVGLALGAATFIANAFGWGRRS